MDERFRALMAQAHEIGIQYTGDDPEELEMFLAMAVAEKGKNHPVACYGLSFDETASQCRICQLRAPCGDLCGKPRVVVLNPKTDVQPIACEVCGEGRLSAELFDADGNLVDYACEGGSPGCPNRVTIQCGWEPEKKAPEIVIADQTEAEDPAEEEESEGEDEPEAEEEEAEGEEEPKAEEEEALAGGAPAEIPLPDPQARLRRLVKGAAAKEAAAKLAQISEKHVAAQDAPARVGHPPSLPVEAPPKRRGRPPKAREAAPVALQASASEAAGEAPKKRRGRPPKVREAAPAAPSALSPVAPPASRAAPPQQDRALVFRYSGDAYRSLGQVVRAITGSTAWSAKRFFGVDPAALSAGESLAREWLGKTHRVTVEIAND